MTTTYHHQPQHHMPPTPDGKPWDFSQVLDLINSLSPKAPATASSPAPRELSPQEEPRTVESDESNATLGNFNRVWEFLGIPRDAPSPSVAVATPPTSDTSLERSKEAYISDGALYYQPTNKGVRWCDVVDHKQRLSTRGGDDFFDPGPEVSDTPGKDTPPLTKTQRKRENRKARRQAESEQPTVKSKAVSDLESEDDAELRKTPARKASVHTLATTEQTVKEPTHHYNLRSRKLATTPQAAKIKDAPLPPAAPHTEPKKLYSWKSGVQFPPSTPVDILTKNSRKLEDSPIPLNLPGRSAASKGQSVSPKKRNLLTSRSPPKHSELTSVTSPAPASFKSDYYNAILNQKPLVFQSSGASSQQQGKLLTIRDKDDRNIHFLLTLIRDFHEDKHWLAKPAQLVNHTQSPDGIHVFIDFSNIHIGFQNRVKTIRGLPVHARIRREDIDFDALVLLMERRRPVTKRILVGSLPSIPAFEKAKAIGYETNILDKVFKARELTERQKYFRQRDAESQQQRGGKGHARTTSGEASGGGSGSGGSGSGSETSGAVANAPQFAKEAWVEQGVDEILHLKMLESIVDVDQPSTIVLATGDAAAAEYSKGFMCMVERALKKGWRVELVSWRDGISGQYTKKDFRQKWGDKFRIVELDDYVEDLLDT